MVVNKTEISLYRRCLWICNTLFHQFVAIASIYILWITLKNFSLDPWTWHIVLCTIAFVPLMAEGIILFSGDNLWSQSINRTTKYWIHGSILGLSAILMSIGIIILIVEIEKNHQPHFADVHPIAGLISWIFVFLAVFMGAFSAKAQNLKAIAKPVYFKLAHNIVGIIAFSVGVFCIGYAIFFDTYTPYMSHAAQVGVAVLLGFIGFWALLEAFKSVYGQLKTIFS